MMRVFVAADLPEALREALVALQAEIPVGRIMAPDTLHLTLAFLGDQSQEAVEAVHEALTALRADRFELHFSGLATFPDHAPTVLWAQAEPSPELVRLHAAVRRAVERAGVRLRRERFRPHVTLARLRQPEPAELARLARFLESRGTLALPTAPVASFGLYRSLLRPDGARHEALAQYPLA